jgi:hypothetical protein
MEKRLARYEMKGDKTRAAKLQEIIADFKKMLKAEGEQQ